MPKMAVGVPRLFFPDVHTADVFVGPSANRSNCFHKESMRFTPCPFSLVHYMKNAVKTSGAGETEIKIRKLCRTMPKMAVGVPRLFFPDVHTDFRFTSA
jgi:hypothetical protein